MTYVDFTQQLIRNLIKSHQAQKLLVFAPACPITEISMLKDVNIQPLHDLYITRIQSSQAIIDVVRPVDFFETLQRNLDKVDGFRYDIIILPRVLEHIEYRKLDWFITLLAYNLVESGYIHVIVPDMRESLKMLDKALSENDAFRIQRNMFEIFNEGEGNDRHATWTDRDFVQYYLEREGHFKVIQINHVQLDGSNDVVAPNIHAIAKRL